MKIARQLSSLTVLLLCSCFASEDSTVTVYVSADDYVARQVFDAFTEQTGIEVNWVGDTEASKTTALVHRLIKEKEFPVADVFWSSEILGTMELHLNDLLLPYSSAQSNAWPVQYKDEHLHWFAFSPRARVIAYDPLVVSEAELPETWWEYDDAVFADPRFGTTGTHFAVLSQFPNQFDELLQKLKTMPMLGGNAATLQEVIDGNAKFAMTDTDDVFAAKSRGIKIEMVLPRHHDEEGGGTLYIPNTISMIKGCKHPRAAGQFIDFMLSDEVAKILAESVSKNFPIQEHLQVKFPELKMIDPIAVDYSKLLMIKNDVIERSLKELNTSR